MLIETLGLWHFSFNRTKVGLKLHRSRLSGYVGHGFNRTKVGLKQNVVLRAILGGIVLIEPKWDWNNDRISTAKRNVFGFNRTKVGLKLHRSRLSGYVGPGFNRTKVGLKQQRRQNETVAERDVLIEPKWDWNSSWNGGVVANGRVLIEPKWDWNELGARLQALTELSFNRTKVGLKLEIRKWRTSEIRVLIEAKWDWNRKNHHVIVFFPKVLIEPKWDWNGGGLVDEGVRLRF